jgi:hypothetical protein
VLSFLGWLYNPILSHSDLLCLNFGVEHTPVNKNPGGTQICSLTDLRGYGSQNQPCQQRGRFLEVGHVVPVTVSCVTT